MKSSPSPFGLPDNPIKITLLLLVDRKGAADALIEISLDDVQYFVNYRNMEATTAVRRLSALAQDGRLEVFRLLVKAGPAGLAAGEIARRLETAANTMSTQLLVLANAGLVRARREGRSIIYAVDYPSISELLVFLMEDCCGGRAEICAPLISIANDCCQPKGVRHEAPARSRRRG